MAIPDKILITACLLLRGDGGDSIGFFFACFSLKAAPRHQGIGPDHNRRGGSGWLWLLFSTSPPGQGAPRGDSPP